MTVRSQAQSTTWILLGAAFGCFGFALGSLTGFSVAVGMSSLLLSSVFSFVGGALLSYVGVRRATENEAIATDPVRVASIVAGLSRAHDARHRDFVGARV